MGKRLVLVGGGHAHMMSLANLDTFVEKGHSVTVIGPSAHHYYSGMGPGMLGKTYTAGEIRFATQQVVEQKGGTFVLDRVVRVHADKKIIDMESGQEIPYDVVSFNAGSYVPEMGIKGNRQNVYAVKPIEKLREARERIRLILSQQSISIGVVGGGPSSAEIAGNVWRLARDPGKNDAIITIFAGKAFMKNFPQGVRQRALQSLRARNIKILEGDRVDRVEDGTLILEDGKSAKMDFIFLAIGVKPSPIFSASGIPVGPDGGLLVNRYLQSKEYPDMFGGGDCICFHDQPLDKVGVYAVRQNPVLLNNLMARLEGGKLQHFDPGGDYLLIINLGDGTGILRKKWLTFGGRLAFIVKDYIDRRFMKTFQAIER